MVTSRIARSLGVDRAVIFHVDDIGMCHGSNLGFLDLAARGYVTCGSVMVPCPWFREIGEARRSSVRGRPVSNRPISMRIWRRLVSASTHTSPDDNE